MKEGWKKWSMLDRGRSRWRDVNEKKKEGAEVI